MDAGLRPGEKALRCKDLNLKRGRIHVRRSWDQCEGEIEPKSSAASSYGGHRAQATRVQRAKPSPCQPSQSPKRRGSAVATSATSPALRSAPSHGSHADLRPCAVHLGALRVDRQRTPPSALGAAPQYRGSRGGKRLRGTRPSAPPGPSPTSRRTAESPRGGLTTGPPAAEMDERGERR